jgi:hypothetical protein
MASFTAPHSFSPLKEIAICGPPGSDPIKVPGHSESPIHRRDRALDCFAFVWVRVRIREQLNPSLTIRHRVDVDRRWIVDKRARRLAIVGLETATNGYDVARLGVDQSSLNRGIARMFVTLTDQIKDRPVCLGRSSDSKTHQKCAR